MTHKNLASDTDIETNNSDQWEIVLIFWVLQSTKFVLWQAVQTQMNSHKSVISSGSALLAKIKVRKL